MFTIFCVALIYGFPPAPDHHPYTVYGFQLYLKGSSKREMRLVGKNPHNIGFFDWRSLNNIVFFWRPLRINFTHCFTSNWNETCGKKVTQYRFFVLRSTRLLSKRPKILTTITKLFYLVLYSFLSHHNFTSTPFSMFIINQTKYSYDR